MGSLHRRTGLLLIITTLLLLLAAGEARSQWGASVTAESDYRFRGVSLSNEKPDLHLSLAYDHASGWYAGAAVARVELEREQRDAQWLGYIGHARRLTAGLSTELGLVASHVGGAAHYDYAELYTGLAAERWSARLYYSPDYFGRGVQTLYTELNVNLPLGEALRAFGHAGALTRLRGLAPHGGPRTRYDVRLGLSLSATQASQLQLAWTTTTRGGAYPANYARKRSAVVLSAAYFF